MPAALPFIPALVGAAGSVVGGILGSNASNKASQQLVDAQGRVIDQTNKQVTAGQELATTGTTNANDILSRSATTQLGMYAPYAEAGTASLNSLQQLSGTGGPLDQQFSFNPTDLQSDPGYQFTLQQGQQAIQRAAAAKGGLFSSGTLKSLAGYTTGTANQYFNDAYNRAANTFTTNRSTALSRIGTLQGIAGMGYSATGAGAGAVGSTSAQQAQNDNSTGQFNANLGMRGNDTIAGAITGQGNAQAAGTLGSTSNYQGMLNGIGNSTQSAIINKFLLDRGVFGNPAGGGGFTPNSGIPGWGDSGNPNGSGVPGGIPLS